MSARKNKSAQTVASTTSPGGLLSSSKFRLGLGAALIVCLAFFAYKPCFQGRFILDDDLLVTQNQLIKSPSGLWDFWFTTKAIDYWPTSNSTLWLEWRIWGDNPVGYRVTNVLLHAVECLLIWLILRRLSIPGAYFAAVLFAIHPVNVDSVAWVASRKNLVALFFSLLSVLCYLNLEIPSAEGERSFGKKALWYGLSFVCFILAVLGKGSVVILPALLLLILLWRRRLVIGDFLRTAPFFVAAAGLGWVNVWFQTHGVHDVGRHANFVERLLTAAGAVWFYLYKALLPINLCFVYPMWTDAERQGRFWLALVAAMAVTAALLFNRNSKVGRPLLFAWFFFIIALFPALGFADIGFMDYSLVADRYLHIALIGLVALVGAAWAWWFRSSPGVQPFALISAVVVAACFFGLTFEHAGLYCEPNRLYETTLARNPGAWMIRNNYGLSFQQKNDWAGAVRQYEQVIKEKPDYGPAYTNIGNALAQLGRLPEAIEMLEKSIKIDPKASEAVCNLGNAYILSGRLEDGIAEYKKALAIQPDYVEAMGNLTVTLIRAKRYSEAVEYGLQAVKTKPDFPEYRSQLAVAALGVKNYSLAAEQYEILLRADPNSVSHLNNYGIALEGLNQIPEAIRKYQLAVKINPNFVQTYLNLCTAFDKLGMAEPAEDAAKAALKLAQSQGDADRVKRIQDWLAKRPSK